MFDFFLYVLPYTFHENKILGEFEFNDKVSTES